MKTKAPFKQSDLVRAIRAARVAGVTALRVEIEGGKITMLLATEREAEQIKQVAAKAAAQKKRVYD